VSAKRDFGQVFFPLNCALKSGINVVLLTKEELVEIRIMSKIIILTHGK
jgi:hypothetical protein